MQLNFRRINRSAARLQYSHYSPGQLPRGCTAECFWRNSICMTNSLILQNLNLIVNNHDWNFIFLTTTQIAIDEKSTWLCVRALNWGNITRDANYFRLISDSKATITIFFNMIKTTISINSKSSSSLQSKKPNEIPIVKVRVREIQIENKFS